MKGDLQPEVDVYRPEGTPADFWYRKIKTCGFVDYLSEKGMRVLGFTREEQDNGVSNVVLTGPNKFIGIRAPVQAYESKLLAHGVQFKSVDFTALSGGYGGPHCSTQVIYRAG